MANLSHNTCHFGFRHGLQFFQLFKQLPSHCYFHQDVDINSIIEKPIHSYNVGMVQKKLNFQLTHKLLCDFFLNNKFFLDDFDSADKICLLFPCQENMPIFPCTELLNLFKVIYWYFLLFFLFHDFFTQSFVGSWSSSFVLLEG